MQLVRGGRLTIFVWLRSSIGWCCWLHDYIGYFVEDDGKIGFVVCWFRNFMVLHSALFEIVWESTVIYTMPIGSVGRRVVILS